MTLRCLLNPWRFTSHLYPDKDEAFRQADGVAKQLNKGSPKIDFAHNVVELVFRDSSVRRLFRDGNNSNFAWSYYQNCLEEPENYLSDYKSIMK